MVLKPKRLKTLRVDRDLSQEALAEAIGVTRDRLQRIETKSSRATPAERQALVAELNRVGRRFGHDPLVAEELDILVDKRGATRGRPPKPGKEKGGAARGGSSLAPEVVTN